MKRFVVFFFLLVSIVFAKEELIVGYPLNLTDMYLYMDLENSQYNGVYVDLLNNFDKANKEKYSFKYVGDENKADILLRVSQDNEKKGYKYIVTPISYRAVVLVNINSPFTDIDDLYGLKLGYVENQRGMKEIEERNKGLKIHKIAYNDQNQAIIALKNNKVDALVLKDWNENNHIERNFRIISSAKFKEKIGVSENKIALYDKIKAYFINLEKKILLESIRKNRIEFYKYLLKDTPNYEVIKTKYSDIKVVLLDEEYFLPIYYRENGYYKGIVFEILKDIEKILEIPTNVIYEKELANILGIYIPRKNDIYFGTKPYYKAKIGVAKIKNDLKVSNLDNSTIIIIKERLEKSFLEKNIKGAKFIDVTTIDEGIEKLLNKEGDYLICYLEPLRAIVYNNKNLQEKITVTNIFNDIEIGISLGVKESNSELYNVICSVLESYNIIENQQ